MTARRAALAATLAALVLGGCASIPTSGPVRTGQDARYDLEDSQVRVLPPPPRPGATPENIVRGFLLAAASFDGDHEAARAYLSPKVSDRWRPERGVRVYDSGSFTVQGASVGPRISFDQVATITSEGRYVPLAAPVARSERFTMARVDGQWRIDGLSDGLLLATFDVRRAYRPGIVYFLDPDRRMVVPDLVLLPNRSTRATQLVTRLLTGPTSWLAPAVDSAVPPGTRLTVDSVPVVDGVAEVDLDPVALAAGAPDRQAMAAQIVWTLRQLSDVRAVRITVDGREFPVPGAAAEQSRESWPNFDPGGLPVNAEAYLVRGGRLGTLDGARFLPVPGPAGDGRRPMERPAVSLTGDLVAGLSADHGILFRGPLGRDDQLSVAVTGGDLTAPSWDRAGTLWTVDRAAGGGRVLVVAADGTVSTVATEGAGGVRAVRAARDGTRVALVVRRPSGRDELLVGTVRRGDDGRTPVVIAGLSSVAPELVAVRDVAWVDAVRLAVLGRAAGGVLAPRVVDANGYGVTPMSPIDAVVVAAAPGNRPLLVGTAAEEIYESSGRSWTLVGPGAWPAYPG